MLVSGSDLSFVAAAVQTWSLPQRAAKDLKAPTRTPSKINFTSSLALLLLVAIANAGQGLIANGSLIGKAIVAWAILEVLYFIYGQHRIARVNAIVDVPLDLERVELIKERFLTLATVMPIDDFLSGWFHGVPAKNVKRRNVEDFVAYGFYCRTVEQLSPQLRKSVSDFVVDLEESYGTKLEDGFNANITFMAHMWEPLRTLPTPLFIHAGSALGGFISQCVLRLWGFERRSCEGLDYWFRPGTEGPPACETPRAHRTAHYSGVRTRSMTSGVHMRGDSAASLSASGEERPLVFIHGVGFGIMPYLTFLRKLVRRNSDHPVLVLDVPHVALRPFTRAKNVDSIAAATHAIMQTHGFTDACFIGHSFGSFCISRICQLYPEIVDSIALVDPVCCLTCYPQLLASFVYKTYSLQEATGSIMGFAHAVRFIFSRDLIIAETFCRQFLWHSLMLWPDDMPAKSVISLSANDDLVPANLVRAHLEETKSRATVMLHPTAAHGGVFLDGAHVNELLSHVRKLLQSC